MARSKRLDKKMHLNEFQDMGFEVSFSVKEDFSHPNSLKIFDDFVLNAIECNGLSCGGGAGADAYTAKFFVDKVRPQKNYPWKHVYVSADEQDRANVQLWLEAQADIVMFNVGPLTDAWHG